MIVYDEYIDNQIFDIVWSNELARLSEASSVVVPGCPRLSQGVPGCPPRSKHPLVPAPSDQLIQCLVLWVVCLEFNDILVRSWEQWSGVRPTCHEQSSK